MSSLHAIDPAWAWVLAGFVLMGGELLLPGVFLVWLGLAAFVTGLVETAFDLPWQAQLPLFAVLSVIAVTLSTRLNRGHVPLLNRGAHGLIGRDIVLDTAIVEGSGRARVDDTLWRVSGPDLPAGTRVRVTGVEGTVLTVAAVS
ncbi:NfeD family protein [Methylobacterium haplocladii]|uniref:Membrane protein n=1 Tax=Methylobacterium haplocladii TaxID=1176176 RepID=A0A512INX0_9HYPH|nr:NfeD family protein [Methylobacterium haplocladii]GEO99352.1 membrane protein [Methylobacterium haplocladii]GJD83446.1 Inner membrane protein YbbJ [Methylobacterium haplocladii]GLS60377.1 membrane protein [Methylobacterium haplocladii]